MDRRLFLKGALGLVAASAGLAPLASAPTETDEEWFWRIHEARWKEFRESMMYDATTPEAVSITNVWASANCWEARA